jgi:hypothetical protein
LRHISQKIFCCKAWDLRPLIQKHFYISLAGCSWGVYCRLRSILRKAY